MRTKVAETGYTLNILEARRSHGRNPGTHLPGIAAYPRQSLRIRGKVVEPRVDFRRVAPSRLPEHSYAYINPCIGPKRKQFFLGEVFDLG